VRDCLLHQVRPRLEAHGEGSCRRVEHELAALAGLQETHRLTDAQLGDLQAHIAVCGGHEVGHEVDEDGADHAAVGDVVHRAVTGLGDLTQERHVQCLAESVADRVHRHPRSGMGVAPGPKGADDAARRRVGRIGLTIRLEDDDHVTLLVDRADAIGDLQRTLETQPDVRAAVGCDKRQTGLCDRLARCMHEGGLERDSGVVVEQNQCQLILGPKELDLRGHRVAHEVRAAEGGGLGGCLRCVHTGVAHAAADVEDIDERRGQHAIRGCH
jgi:hypothetical protein